jgi:peptidyl-prolyl cis-trans isomerase SurA
MNLQRDMKKLPFYLGLLLLLPLHALSQDEVLFTLDDQPVMRSEFERVYHKNSNIEGFENKPAAEYLELFINFKLKVHEAIKLGYDTVAAFRTELAGYREQLAKPYLQDRRLIDSLLQEAYYRTVNEVNASHIMVKLPANPVPADTLTAFRKALDIRKRLLNGESFEKIAREESDDPSAKINEGRLGWFSGFAMVLPFEDAAYHLEIGGISQPVRSRYGYHIIRLNDKRPALGEIKLAHIMIRARRDDSPEIQERAKNKIDTCYNLLQQGSRFSEIAAQYSEDAGSSKSGGQMRWFRSGELPPNIEELVFAIHDSGSYTIPVQSDYGWHIFRVEGRRPIAPFEQMKSQLEERVMADERGKMSDAAMINRIKKESGLVVYPQNISGLTSVMDSSVYKGNWNVAIAGDLIEPVFAIGTREYTQKQLADYIVQTKRYRNSEPLGTLVERKSAELINQELLDYEKGQLETKYPDFKYLMEEYHDGILLFNIMDSMVWSKAVSDTGGLRNFYHLHRNDYLWKERADVSLYTLQDQTYLKSTRKLARKRADMNMTAAEMRKAVCSQDTMPCIEITDRLYEPGELPAGIAWEKGSISEVQGNNNIQLFVVNRILPPGPKSFGEIRGQITADYQNYLDQQWITTLRARYPVVINNSVLQQIH